ncbi:hypothetical protein BJ322DRAFT_1078578 [Thelephora terrestris]|uniref:F-box domain-containing protein n=1 Tax=Thelephora terrestris TaxID=56493 RepID=A0A9P6L461_9AGAM|nr:hypothetical protein BJ322DRAFT_1078578 [Thelephora terrestris]
MSGCVPEPVGARQVAVKLSACHFTSGFFDSDRDGGAVQTGTSAPSGTHYSAPSTFSPKGMVDLSLHLRALGQRVGSFVGVAEHEFVDLDSISATIHCGCMSLPQELVDHIIDTLHDDLLALKACSLTCKSMFASTRHLIHQTLCLTPRNNESVLTREEEKQLRSPKWKYQDVQLRFLSYMGERGFLQYTRKVYIHNARQGDTHNTGSFTPDTLRPHMHHFQSLDRAHAITIELYDGDVWASHHKSCFAHFNPTLTSLTLRRPLGHYRRVLQFVLQFPNLENLCLEWLDGNVGRARPTLTAPTIFNPSSLPHGHFRLAHIDGTVHWPTDFAYELGNGFTFQSVELEDSFGDHGQHLLDTCSDNIKDLTITPSSKGYQLLKTLKLKEIKDLRRLTIRPVYLTYSDLAFDFPPILTITSTTLSELVLELGRLRPSLYEICWGRWGKTDRFLYQRFAKQGEFRLIIRAGNIYALDAFQRHAKEGFPLLASRGCIYFETSPSIDNYWR